MIEELDLPSALKPPMENGEVVFETPWQSRIFGMAIVLSEQGHFSWAEFQRYLIACISDWEKQGSSTDYAYFDHFSQALFSITQDKNLIADAELEDLTRAFLARPHGHDH